MPISRSARGRYTRRSRDRGAQMIEFAVYFPVLLLVVILAMEVFASFSAMERIESAARAGARVGGQGGFDTADSTARQALPDWLDDADIRSGANGDGGVYTEVSVNAPIMWKNAPFDIELKRRVEMPTV